MFGRERGFAAPRGAAEHDERIAWNDDFVQTIQSRKDADGYWAAR